MFPSVERKKIRQMADDVRRGKELIMQDSKQTRLLARQLRVRYRGMPLFIGRDRKCKITIVKIIRRK